MFAGRHVRIIGTESIPKRTQRDASGAGRWAAALASRVVRPPPAVRQHITGGGLVLPNSLLARALALPDFGGQLITV
jgi:hypothetical protein